MALKCYLGLAGVLFQISTVQALEALDEAAMSNVTGQAQGIRLTSEYDSSIKSISYYDDDGLGADGSGGVISLSPVRVYTPTNRPLIVDVQVGEKVRDNGETRTGLLFYNRDLPINIEVGSIAINGKSIGGFGQQNFQIKNNLNADPSDDQVYTVDLFAGGAVGNNGITLDIDLPSSMSFDTYYEDDGVRLSSTVDFGNPFDASGGGLKMSGVTFDLVPEGLQIGLPTITGGNVNVYNASIGDEVLNSAAYRNINLKGGALLLKNAEQAGESGLEIDLRVNKDSSLDYVYIAGEVDENYLAGNPGTEIYEGSATISFEDDLLVQGMRMNVDGERGLVFDFDNTTATDGVRAHLQGRNIRFDRADRAAAGIHSPSIGTIDARLHLTNNTYLQVQGH
ncbi:DUF6160 family protein [Bacterioplanoides pacificum]|uniref:DUF6160 family protein n=1 Tax=Bacterioplanoides pacificum TaxID=1171596 RepID=A0ABV7VWS5_9GAMM